MRYSEDLLKLIGKDIFLCKANEFCAQVAALRQEKPARTKIKEPKLKGKFLAKPTKSAKRPEGVFQVSFGVFVFNFIFQRDLNIAAASIDEAVKILQCDQNKLRDFLVSKKFAC